jgi:hypothetical protein
VLLSRKSDASKICGTSLFEDFEVKAGSFEGPSRSSGSTTVTGPYVLVDGDECCEGEFGHDGDQGVEVVEEFNVVFATAYEKVSLSDFEFRSTYGPACSRASHVMIIRTGYG